MLLLRGKEKEGALGRVWEGEGVTGGYNIISRVGVVKKGGGADDPRFVFLSLWLSFSLDFPFPRSPPPPSHAGLPPGSVAVVVAAF